MKNLLVVGSINMDVVVSVPHIPQPGETILACDVKKYCGGKGANQALAAARLGGDVCIIGKLGNDEHGKILTKNLTDNNVSIKGLMIDNESVSGTAYIYVDDAGQNSITVCQGANKKLTTEDIIKNEGLFDNAEFCIIQLEIPIEVVNFTVDLCWRKGIKVILNPAPAQRLSDDILKKTYIITPNETELSILSTNTIKSIEDIEYGSKLLLDKGVKNVITTIGDKGSYLVNSNCSRLFKAVKVKAVDTTGAGDCYTGALSVSLNKGSSIEDAIKFASFASTLSVTKKGAQSSLPYINEVEKFMQKNS